MVSPRDALLAALPFAAVAALVTFGDYIDSRERLGRAQSLCSAAIVVLLVISCAVRNNARPRRAAARRRRRSSPWSACSG